MAKENKFGYDEIVDTISDFVEVEENVKKALSDGLQFTDALIILQEYPRIEEAVKDWPIFQAQVADLIPEEGQNALVDVKNRVGGKAKTSYVFRVFENAVQSYNYIDDVVKGGLAQFELWRNVFASPPPPQV